MQPDFDMQPAWARKFEPPAVTGGEARSAVNALLLLYRETGKERFLDPIRRALDYYRLSRLPDGRLARFYELGSNRPLYFTRDYTLTYDDGDLPTHYAFTIGDWTGALEREYERVRATPLDQLKTDHANQPKRPDARLINEVRQIVAAQDARGRWVEDGGLRYHRPADSSLRVIDTSTFNRHVEILSRYLAATRAEGSALSAGP